VKHNKLYSVSTVIIPLIVLPVFDQIYSHDLGLRLHAVVSTSFLLFSKVWFITLSLSSGFAFTLIIFVSVRLLVDRVCY